MTLCDFYSSRKIKETKGEGKELASFVHSPQPAFGQVNFKLKGASRRSTAFNAFDSIYFTIDDFRISSLWVSYELDSLIVAPLNVEIHSWIPLFKIVIKLRIII